jgi:hypothetical protein
MGKRLEEPVPYTQAKIRRVNPPVSRMWLHAGLMQAILVTHLAILHLSSTICVTHVAPCWPHAGHLIGTPYVHWCPNQAIFAAILGHMCDTPPTRNGAAVTVCPNQAFFAAILGHMCHTPPTSMVQPSQCVPIRRFLPPFWATCVTHLHPSKPAPPTSIGRCLNFTRKMETKENKTRTLWCPWAPKISEPRVT